MDTSLGFAVFVLAMCALELVWTASERLNAWWLRHVSPRQKSAAREHDRPGRRSDWYAFFHCADLVGQEPVQREAPGNPARTVTERKILRPRLNLS